MNRRQNLDELDPPAWGEPTFSSHLVTACHALRKKPVADFETEDLRMMIGQAIGLQWLVPLALDVLERDPWVVGAYYEGDLLVSTVGGERRLLVRTSKAGRTNSKDRERARRCKAPER